jgi:hypothetical protein
VVFHGIDPDHRCMKESDIMGVLQETVAKKKAA